MSGIRIDVDVGGNSAKDIATINKNIKSIGTTTTEVNKTLKGSLGASSFANLNKTIMGLIPNFAKLGSSAASSMSSVSKSAAESTKELNSMTGTVAKLGKMFAGLAASVVAVSSADSFVNMQNKLALVTDSMESLNELQDRLVKSSRDTRSSLSATVDLYSKFSMALSETETSSKSFLVATKVIQQAAVISGSSMQAANEAIIQLGQGLSSGVLRGQELNSILEQLPRAARLLADNLGVGIGELRKMGEEGELTADKVFDAIIKGADKIDDEFKKTSMSITQGVTVMSDAFIILLGNIDKLLNVSVSIGNAAISIAKSLTSLGNSITVIAEKTKVSVNDYVKSMTVFRFWADVLASIKIGTVRFIDLSQAQHEIAAVKEIVYWVSRLKEVDKIRQMFNELLSSINRVIPSLLQVIKLTTSMIYAFVSAFSTFKYMIPQVMGPVLNLVDQFRLTMSTIVVRFFAGTSQMIFRAEMMVRAVTEQLGLFILFDRRTERAIAALASSTSWDDLIQKFFALGRAAGTRNISDFFINIGDKTVLVRGIAQSMHQFLAVLGLVNTKLVYINNVRFDRLMRSMETIGVAFGMLYRGFILPRVSVLLSELYSKIMAIAIPITQTLGAMFASIDGRAIAKSLVTSISSVINSVSKSIVGMIDTVGWDKVQSNIAKAAMGMIKEIGAFLRTVVNMLLNIDVSAPVKQLRDRLIAAVEGIDFKGIYTILLTKIKELVEFMARALETAVKYITSGKLINSLKDGFANLRSALNPGNVFEDMISQINQSSKKLLSGGLKVIVSFINMIIDLFKHAYEVVVGHSYWPDLIDGVIAYAKRILEAYPAIKNFVDKVSDSFSGMFSAVMNDKDPIAILKNFFNSLISALNSSFTNVSKKVGVIIIESIVFAFLSAEKRMIFIVEHTLALLYKLFKTSPDIAGALFENIGMSVGLYVAEVGKIAKQAINAVVLMMPSFAKGILGATNSTVGKMLGDFVGAMPPVIATTLLAAILTFKKQLKAQAGEFLTGKFVQPFFAGLEAMTNAFMTKTGTGGIMQYWLFGTHPATLAAGALFAIHRIFTDISASSLALIGVPLIYTLLMGDKGTGPTVARLTKDIFGVLIPAIFSPLTSTVSAFGSKVGAAMARVIAKVKADTISKLRGGVIPGQLLIGTNPSALQMAATKLKEELKRVFSNIARGWSDYKKGFIDIWQLLFGVTDTQNAARKFVDALKAPLKIIKDTVSKDLSNAFSPEARAKIKNAWTDLMGFMAKGFAGLITVISVGLGKLAGAMSVAGGSSKFLFAAIGILLSLFASGAFAADIGGVTHATMGLADALGECALTIIGFVAVAKTLRVIKDTRAYMKDGDNFFTAFGKSLKDMVTDMKKSAGSIKDFFVGMATRIGTFVGSFKSTGGLLVGMVTLIPRALWAMGAALAGVLTSASVLIPVLVVLGAVFAGILIWGRDFTDGIADIAKGLGKFFGIIETTPLEELRNNFEKLTDKIPKKINLLQIDRAALLEGIDLSAMSRRELDTLTSSLNGLGSAGKKASNEFAATNQISEKSMAKLNDELDRFYMLKDNLPKTGAVKSVNQELEGLYRTLSLGPSTREKMGSAAERLQKDLKSFNVMDPLKLPVEPFLDFSGTAKFKEQSIKYLSEVRIMMADFGEFQNFLNPAELTNVAKLVHDIGENATGRQTGEKRVNKEMDAQLVALDEQLTKYRQIGNQRKEDFGEFKEEVSVIQMLASAAGSAIGSKWASAGSMGLISENQLKSMKGNLTKWSLDMSLVFDKSERDVLKSYADTASQLEARMAGDRTNPFNVARRQAHNANEAAMKEFAEIAKKADQFGSGLEQAFASAKTGLEASQIQDILDKAPDLAAKLVKAGSAFAAANNDLMHLPVRAVDESAEEYNQRIQSFISRLKESGDQLKNIGLEIKAKIPKNMFDEFNKQLSEIGAQQISTDQFLKIANSANGLGKELQRLADMKVAIPKLAGPEQIAALADYERGVRKLETAIMAFGMTTEDVAAKAGIAMSKLLQNPAAKARAEALQVRLKTLQDEAKNLEPQALGDGGVIINLNVEAQRKAIGVQMAQVEEEISNQAAHMSVDWRTPFSQIDKEFAEGFSKVGLTAMSQADFGAMDKAGQDKVNQIKGYAATLNRTWSDKKTPEGIARLRYALSQLDATIADIKVTAEAANPTIETLLGQLGLDSSFTEGVYDNVEALDELYKKMYALSELKKLPATPERLRAVDQATYEIDQAQAALARKYSNYSSFLSKGAIPGGLELALSAKVQSDLRDIQAGIDVLTKARDKVNLSKSGGMATAVIMTKSLDNMQRNLEANIEEGLKDHPFELTQYKLKKLGIDFGDLLGTFNGTTLEQVRFLADLLDEARVELENKEGALTPERRKELILRIRSYNEVLDKLRVTLDDLAKQSGESFLQTMKSSIDEQVTAFAQLKQSGMTTLKNTARTFTETLVKSFVDGMTEAMFKASGTEKMMKDLGSEFFKWGAALLSGIGSFFGGSPAASGGGGGAYGPGFEPKALGGPITGPGTGTSDSIPALLSNNEYVIRASRAQMFRPLLDAINYGKGTPKFATGGPVNLGYGNNAMSSSVARRDKEMNLSSKKALAQTFNINVTGDVSRQTRNEISRMPREIASMVNKQNVEWNKKQ